MSIPTVAELERAFRFLHLAPDAVNAHSIRISNYLARYPFQHFALRKHGLTPEVSIVEYEFGETGYSVDKAKPSDAPNFTPSQHGGTQCDSENILMLARTLEIAETTIPEVWMNPDADLHGKLTSPRQHLDTLNEFWWLSRWSPNFTATQNYRMNPGCEKDVDWHLKWNFGLSNIAVNLEVKRRIGDVLRSAQGEAVEPNKIFSAGLKDNHGNAKFRPSTPDEVNVLGLTLIGEIDRSVQTEAEKWLLNQSDVDAVLFFSRFSKNRSGFDAQIRDKAGLLNSVLNRELGSLDLSLHSCVEAPLPYSVSQLRYLP